MNKNQVISVIVACLFVVGMILSVALMIIGANTIDLPLPGTLYSRPLLGALTLFSIVQLTFLVGSFVVLWVRARLDNLTISTLLVPSLAVKMALWYTIALPVLATIDYLVHGYHQGWPFLMAGGVKAAFTLFFVATVIALTWFHIRFLHGSGWSFGRAWLLMLSFVVVAVLIVAGILIYTQAVL